jgi:hypothetical protein
MSWRRLVAVSTLVSMFCACIASPAWAGPQASAPTVESAEQTIVDGYVSKQIACTPEMPPAFESITWDPPGFVPATGGSGMITDANPALGGQFTAAWTGSEWSVEYLYC